MLQDRRAKTAELQRMFGLAGRLGVSVRGLGDRPPELVCVVIVVGVMRPGIALGGDEAGMSFLPFSSC